MKFGFPCSVKGIRPDAHRIAEEAARRAGLPLNDWFNAIILQQAATQGIMASAPARHGNEGTFGDLSGLHLRLDDLTRRIDEMTRSASAAYAPKKDREESERFAELFARLEQRFDRLADNISRPSAPPPTPSTHASGLAPGLASDLAPGLDRAIAEIAARRYFLNGEPTPAPAQDLTNLESQLRRITDQIETLRRPGVEEAIAALRAELREIGCALDEAMPRRAIETIEKQIQDLAYRVAEGHESGVDGRSLAGIEHGLAEVRDALRGLMPAETLVGYTEAIDALSHRIDLIVAQRDPATMQQLDKSIGMLREMATHTASNETVNRLSAQVQAIADKIEHLAIGGGAGDALNRLELRIDALSRAVSESAHNGAVVAPRLEGLVQSLSEKIGQIRQPRGDEIALGHLEDLVVKLTERLGVTDSRLGNLDAIERGLADLLVHIEDIRANKETAGLRAGGDADLLKQDMARTQDALEAVHGSLDRVGDRLAMIEKDIRGDRQKVVVRDQILDPSQSFGTALPNVGARSPEAAAPLSPDAPLQATVASGAEPKSAPAPSAPMEFFDKSLWSASQAPVDHSADQPLEPGTGRPGFGTNPAIRIAAAEAALGVARPNTVTPGSKSSFIAAARRAAQAASQDPKNRQARSEPSKTGGGENASLRAKVMMRVKGILLAASIAAIIVGSFQLASNLFDFGIFASNEAKLVSDIEADSATSDAAVKNAEHEATAGIVGDKPDTPGTNDADARAILLAPLTMPSLTPAPPAAKAGAAGVSLPLSLFDSGEAPSLVLNPPLLNPPFPGAPASKSDVTGSVARPPAEARPTRQPAPAAQPPATDGLPAAIGGTRLRNAASAGDPAAAYEVAMRFLEGRGVPANLEEAARWYERAASKGLAPAQFRYASMLEKGQGVKKDLGAAQKLYVAAATKGHAKAMHNLAVLYAEGAEGRPDYAGAAQWFRKAAEHGVADSQYNLGVLATRGLGAEKNLAESYKWFALAAAQGDRDAGRKRDDVAAQLDAPTLAAAEEAVKSFVVKTQPAAATVVPEPPGGWDRATPPTQAKPRAAGPLSISDFNSGKL
jgi:localization factor PodJL